MIRLTKKILLDRKGQPLLMIVLIILALSAGAGIYVASGKFFFDDSATRTTMDLMQKVSNAICRISVDVSDKEPLSGRSYCRDVGHYPATLGDGTQSNLLTQTFESTCAPRVAGGNLSGWCGPYMNQPVAGASIFNDSWGNPLVYNTSARTLTSYGPNGIDNSGVGDDIVVPIAENIVTKGLVLYLDAARYDGFSFRGTGCAITSWKDLSSSNLSATLTGFAGCGAGSGWNGTGTTTDPHHLRFDSTNDYVVVADNGVLKPGAVTACVWLQLSSATATTTVGAAPNTMQYIVFKQNSRTSFFEGYALQKGHHVATSNPTFAFGDIAGNQRYAEGTTALGVGTWQHLCGTFERPTISIYMNAALEDTTVNDTPIDYGSTNLFIGRSGDAGYDAYFNGKIAIVTLYNRALNATEIQQNCYAQKSRFNGVTCANDGVD